MATAPWFVISPTALLSTIGLLRGPDRTVPTPTEDWRTAVVDVVIPAYKEEDNIVHCLASIARQTRQPRHVILVDDGGKDRTVERAREFATAIGLDLTVIERASSIGKTPTIKRQSREFDSDVEFILDGDTFLESRDYIERCVQELYQGVGIASACGVIEPVRLKDRAELARTPEEKQLFALFANDGAAQKKVVQDFVTAYNALTELEIPDIWVKAMTPEQVTAMLRTDIGKYAAVIKQNNIRMD